MQDKLRFLLILEKFSIKKQEFLKNTYENIRLNNGSKNHRNFFSINKKKT